jgi:hypothetical protein
MSEVKFVVGCLLAPNRVAEIHARRTAVTLEHDLQRLHANESRVLFGLEPDVPTPML